MTAFDLDSATVDDLRRETRVDDLEAFVKRGRSRRMVVERERETQMEADERGWAVRAAARRGSFFACGSGVLGQGLEWPRPEGRSLRLPDASEAPAVETRQRAGSPLVSESELRRAAREVAAELSKAVPASRLERLELEDGESDSRIASTKGVLAGARTRLATVTLEASAGRSAGGPVRVRAERILPDLRSLSSHGMVERVATLLAVEAAGEPTSAESTEVVADPAVTTALLAGLAPLFIDPRIEEVADALANGGRLGGSALTIVDDGRLRDGPLAAPVDGEGVPTREVVLVEEGAFRQKLLPWWRRRTGSLSGGCCRRDSWREPPRVGPSHLYLRANPGVGPAALRESLSAGFHLLDATGPPRFDLHGDRFALPVRGFEIRAGAIRCPVTRVVLAGTVRGLLRGIRSSASDLTFVLHPVGLLGGPTVRISGLTVRPAR